MTNNNSNLRITTVGAGIVGLTTALKLQETFPNAVHRIIASEFGDDTLSAGAGGIFRPGNGLRAEDDPNGEKVRSWIEHSYDYYKSILNSREASVAGVISVGGYAFSSRNEATTKNKLLSPILPVYRAATPSEVSSICPGNGFKYGSYFETLVTESLRFLPWATEKFISRGGLVNQQYVDSLDELPFGTDFVINCTGLGASKLCNDDRLVPIRGQVYKVKAPWVKMFYYGDYDTYIIPGPTYVTLGGTRNFDSHNTNIDKYDSKSIWERCVKLVPTLANATVVKEFAGLRPYRDRVRVEVDQRTRKVIHNYGHGGYGVTSAPGTAENVKDLLLQELRMNFHERSRL